MSDTPPTPPTPSAGSTFCAECGAAMPADARFCGECGAKPPGAAGAAAGAGTDPTQVSGGASTWQGVAPVVERTEVIPPVPPGAGAPASAGPPPGGAPLAAGAGAPPPPGGGKSKGPLIAAIVIVLALLAGGAFFLLGGDDEDDESAEIVRDNEDEDEDEDEETTTSTEPEEESTTTTEVEGESTTTEVPVAPGITFAQAIDDTGVLVLEVPDFWQANGAPLGDGSPNIIAAEDLNAFVGGFQSSGVSFTRLPGANADPDATIDFLANTNNLFEACTAQERTDYTDGVFTGRRQEFADCEGSGITLVEIVGTRADGVSVEVTVALAPDDPVEIVDRIEATFNLTG